MLCFIVLVFSTSASEANFTNDDKIISCNLYWEKLVGTQLADLNSENYNDRTMSKKSVNPFKRSYVRNGKYHPYNCTWYVWGRMRETTDKEIHFNRKGSNAKQWVYNTTNCSKVDLQDKCVAVTDDGSDVGHVVFVEHVSKEYVYYTEANVNMYSDFRVIKIPIEKFKNLFKVYLK